LPYKRSTWKVKKCVRLPRVVKKESSIANKKMGLEVVSPAMISFSLFLLLASTTQAQSNGVFDVTKYGAGKDITEVS
jgi:hypothetical protein